MGKSIKKETYLLDHSFYALTKQKIKEDIPIIMDGKEYTFLLGYKTPSSVDILYLYYFINILHENDYPKEIYLKWEDIINDISKGCSTFYYSMFEETLRVWRSTGISFKGCFYDGVKYPTLEFGILNYGTIQTNSDIKISFNEKFLSILKNTNFNRHFNFNEFKKLKKTVSRRLYELLSKVTFPYQIDILNLLKEIPVKNSFLPQIIREIKLTVKEINTCTESKIEFSYKKDSSGNTICTFIKNI